MWEPGKSELPISIISKFMDHQSELKNRIEEMDDLVKRRVIISSPANKNIVYTLDKALDILMVHERRHFEQCKEVYQRLQEKI